LPRAGINHLGYSKEAAMPSRGGLLFKTGVRIEPKLEASFPSLPSVKGLAHVFIPSVIVVPFNRLRHPQGSYSATEKRGFPWRWQSFFLAFFLTACREF